MAEKPDHGKVFLHVQHHLEAHKDNVLGAIAGGVFREGGEESDVQVVAGCSAENGPVLIETLRHLCIGAATSLNVSMEELAGYILSGAEYEEIAETEEPQGEALEIPAPIPQPKLGSLEC